RISTEATLAEIRWRAGSKQVRARARVKWAADNSPAAGLELPIVLVAAELGLLIVLVAGLGLPIDLAAGLATREPIVPAAEVAMREPIVLVAAGLELLIALAAEGLAPSQLLAQPAGVAAATASAIDKFPDLP